MKAKGEPYLGYPTVTEFCEKCGEIIHTLYAVENPNEPRIDVAERWRLCRCQRETAEKIQ